MKLKLVLSIFIVIATLAVLSVAFHVRGTSPPNIAMPDLSGNCLNRNVTFSTALTASNMTNVQSWQANITFTPGKIAAMSYTIGSSFTGQNTFTGKNNNTAAGYFSVGMTFYNGRGPFTTTSSVTLFTITWKTVTYHPTVFFHIVTSTENSLGGTMLLNPDQSGQQFSTTDGYLGCDFIQGPSP